MMGKVIGAGVALWREVVIGAVAPQQGRLAPLPHSSFTLGAYIYALNVLENAVLAPTTLDIRLPPN